uniref:TerB family tellurite resistance protein n=1 Tax=Pedobacter schmidteae TaxID=2201271 RepID=UPI000EB2127F|nr:TerB family tellurite resistance protein [Pedobacter schmidteae]
MKKFILILLLFRGCLGVGYAQSQEAQQLLLNVEKLSQLKNILSDMKRGYEVVSKGYNTVKNIAEGNFSLHEVFIDGLMLVSPQVRKYRKVADIVSMQADLVSEYKGAFKRFGSGGNFSVSELEYLGKVYGQLLDQSVDNLDQLVMVITAGKLRMSDEERLRVIDRVFAELEDKLVFLRSFNRETGLLNLQRSREKAELGGMTRFYKTN